MRAVWVAVEAVSMSHTSVGLLMRPPGSEGSFTPEWPFTMRTLPSGALSVIPPWVLTRVPVMDSTPVPRACSTVISRSR
jgi:hypothetical protein